MIGTDGVRKCRPIVAIRLRYTQNIGLGVWSSAITPKFGGGDRVTDNVASYEVKSTGHPPGDFKVGLCW